MVTTFWFYPCRERPIPDPGLASIDGRPHSGDLTTAEPIIDLRSSLGWKRRLPARLLTAGLWGVGLYLAALPLSRLPAPLATAAALSGVGAAPGRPGGPT
jgi:hypothetical protein